VSDVKNSKKSIMKITGKVFLVTLVFVAAAGIYNFSRIQRLYNTVHLFDKAGITENFRSMGTIYDSRVINKGNEKYNFRRSITSLPETYIYKGKEKKVSDFIERTGTTGFIVLRDDTILYEKYYNGNTESSKAISWSVAKSFVSALFGIAVSEGKIRDINQKVNDYVPALAPSGYKDVRIKDVLQMSSGIGFNEDYGDFNSDINRMGRAFALNTPLEDFINSMKQVRTPGTYNLYVSMDTQVLGMIICSATGKSLSSYLEEKLWKPMGMESDALWQIDNKGMEAAFGGLNAVLRDYARFGRLYLNNGNWNGKQLIPAGWIKSSVTPDAPHLMPGLRPTSHNPIGLGYGYQWWIPTKPEGDYLAIGIYGQAIYVNPKYKIVIAKTSAYTDYNKDGDFMEEEAIEMFKAIAGKIK
jgi:CubicO group peptidase (beta-lactamase class C family)